MTITEPLADAVLRLPDPADVTLISTGHAFQIGADTTFNLAADSNEVQARNNGAASTLVLNQAGGGIVCGDVLTANSGLRVGPIVLAEDGSASFPQSVTMQALTARTKLIVDARPSNNPEPLQMINSDTSDWNYVGFWSSFEAPAGTVKRIGYVGQFGPNMRVWADTWLLQLGSGGRNTMTLYEPYILSGGADWNDLNVPGTVIHKSQWINSTNQLANTPCYAANKSGAGNVNNTPFIHFRRNNVTVGRITSPTANTTAYLTTSDYRLKDDHGPIVRAVDRLNALRPIRFVWKEDPRAEYDGFFAHEVAEVVPLAVSGAKDDVVHQAIDNSKLVPLLVAAVQELAGKVAALEAA